AMHNYENVNRAFPPGRTTEPPEHSWAAFMLPYLEQDSAFKLYRFDVDWNHPFNYEAIRTPMVVYTCPSTLAGQRADDTIAASPACGDYATISAIKDFVAINCFGITHLFDPHDPRIIGALVKDQKTKIVDITDGASNTIMVAEDAGRPQLY